jgi:transitional endoplasmic reticulum ATPase
VELWLEMKLPDAAARRTILDQQLSKQRDIFPDLDYAAVLAATEGFTGADLKRVVLDAKSLYAFDRAGGQEQRDPEAYLLQAIEAVALNKQRYAEAEAGARARMAGAPHMGFPVQFGTFRTFN